MKHLGNLKTEQNTEAVRQRVYLAFCSFMEYEGLNPSMKKEIEVTFEHGQWWVIDKTPTTDDGWPKNYSVVDEIPGIDGFGFEEV